MNRRFSRLTALLLALLLVLTSLPGAVFAETAQQPETYVEVIEPTAEPAAEVPVEPTEVPVEPTEVPVEPTEVPVEPTEVPVEPTEVPVEPTEVPVEPTEVPVEPTEVPVEPTEVPVEPTEVPVEPTEVPVEPTEVPVEPTEVPVEPTEVPVEPTEVPSVEPTAEPTPMPEIRIPTFVIHDEANMKDDGDIPDEEIIESTDKLAADPDYRGLDAIDELTEDTTYTYVYGTSGFESAHNYANNTDNVWVYTVSDATAVAVTFSSNTLVETNYDKIYIYGTGSSPLATYTGSSLAGKTIAVTGNTIRVRLYTDGSVTKYGFKVTSVYALDDTPDIVASYAVSSLRVRLTLPATQFPLIDGYDVYHSTVPNGTYYRVGTSITSTDFVTDATFGQINYFIIKAYANFSGTKYYAPYTSNYRSQYCLATPTLYQPTSSGTTMNISFKTIANATAYRIYLATTPDGFDYTDYYTAYPNGNQVVSGTISGLYANTTYYVRMRAEITLSNGVTYVGPYGGIRSVTMGSSGALVAPTMGPATVLSSTSLKITWEPVAGALRYMLYRSDAPSGNYVHIATTTGTEYIDNNPLFGQVNYYKVCAVYSNGTSPLSVYRSTLGLSTPGIQSLYDATNGITVQFSTVAIANGYYVVRGTSASGPFSRIGTVNSTSGSGGGTLTFTDTTAVAGTTYYYRVQAFYDNPINGTRYVGPMCVAKGHTLSGSSTPATRYRAFMVVEHDYETSYTMYRDDNDAMKNMLNGLGGTDYEVTTRSDLTASQIISQIKTCFADATENDVSLFFFSSHGSSSGYLLCYNNTYLNADMLRTALDTIPGKKILVICACYSGNVIGKGGEDAGKIWAQDINDSFIDTFSRKDRANLAASNYYVLTSSSSRETSFSRIYDNSGTERHKISILALVLTKGCGWDYVNDNYCQMYADTNNDDKITLQEAYTYSYNQALSTLSSSGNYQYVQVHPTNSSFVLFED